MESAAGIRTVRLADAYEDLRPLLFSIAHRMLGGAADAEDVVQDAFVRYQRTLQRPGEVGSPKAYLSAVVTRLAIDHLRSARSRRETTVGEWLPEPPLADETALDADVGDADRLSTAFLLLLERLSPVERTVFLLHDAFGFGYDDVAGIVGKSEDNCRQLAVRARRHLDRWTPAASPDRLSPV